MATLEVRDRANQVIGEVEVGAAFERAVKPSVLHEAVVHVQAGERRGTHSTKTRGDVRGSSRKPWRQKGTGRARHGDRRSPIWRHGGIIFGPHPRDHSTRFPSTKMRRALQMALTALREDAAIVVVDDLSIDEPKTRVVAKLLADLGLEGETLIYDPEDDEILARASRNLPGVKVVTGRRLRVTDLLTHDHLLTSKAGIAAIDEALR